MKIPRSKKPSKVVLRKIHSLEEERGTIAVIEPESEDYFLGETLTKALTKAKQKYPGKIFYSIRIGSSFVHKVRGRTRKL